MPSQTRQQSTGRDRDLEADKVRISVAFRLSSGSSSNGLWDLDSGRTLALDAFVRGRPGGEAGIVEFDYDPTRTIYREKFVTIQLYAVKTQLDYAILEMQREPGRAPLP